MVDLFEKATAAVRKLPATDQEQIARMMLSLAEETNARETIDPAHLSDVYESLEQVKRGELPAKRILRPHSDALGHEASVHQQRFHDSS